MEVPAEAEADAVTETGILKMEKENKGSHQWDGPDLKILIAEDQEINLELLSRIISKAGHTVLTAVNGKTAFEKTVSEKPDLILMDVHMPEMDGIEAVHKIREHERKSGTMKRVPIIALTAESDPDSREFLLEKGFDGYVAKPVSVSELYKEIKLVLKI